MNTATVDWLLTQPIWLLAQDGDAATIAADGAAEVTGEPTGNLITQIIGNPLNLILISGILFLLLVMRPQQQQMREHQKALQGLKKNDRIVTSGGIHATVVAAQSGETTVTLRIDDSSGARMTVNRDAIAKIIADESE